MIFDSIQIFVASVVFGVGVAFGLMVEAGSWRNDCDQLGMHRHEQSVYVCHKR